MSKPSERLKELNLTLPPVTTPVGAYVPALRHNELLILSGQIPLANGKVMFTGKAGDEQSLDEAQAAARLCALNGLAVAADAVGGIDNIKRVLRVAVFVASAEGFTDQPKVANGVSDLLVEVFGENGKHARAAVGVAELPLNSTVEVEFLFAV